MKKLIVLTIILLSIKSIALSQNINGLIVPDGKANDSTYLYSAAKVSAILQLGLNLNKYTKLLVSAEREIELLRNTISSGDSTLNRVYFVNQDLTKTIQKKDVQIVALTDNLDIAQRENKTLNRKNKGLKAGGGISLAAVAILTGFLIAK